MVRTPSGWPGMTHTGSVIVRPRYVTCAMRVVRSFTSASSGAMRFAPRDFVESLAEPVRPDDVVRRLIEAAEQRADDLGGMPSVVQRRDQRLLDRYRAVVRAAVAPRLEVMRLGDVPVHELRGLVVVGREVHAKRHLLECVDEFDVGRRVEDRIAA